MRRHVRAVLAIIVVLSAAARFWGLGFGLPHTQARPDETYIIDIARAFLRGQVPPPYYDYPWLYMWALTGLYVGYYVWGLATGAFHSVADLLASWPVHWAPFFLLSRALSATLGSATVVVVFRIGQRLWGDAAGLVAAFFLGVAFLHVRDSHFGTTDVAMTFLIMLSISLLLDAHLEDRRSKFVMAGAVAGLAAATKYNAVLLPVVMLASQILRALELPTGRLRAALDRRWLWFGVPFALLVLVGIPFVLVDFSRFLAVMLSLADSMAVGTPSIALDSGWLHHVKFSLRYGLGLPLLGFGLGGAAALVVSEPKVAARLLSFPVTYYLVAGAVKNLFFRYAMPVVPFLCLTAAYLLCRTVAGLLAWRRTSNAAPSWVFVAAISIGAVAIAAPSALSVWRFDRLVRQTDNRVVVAQWFQEHVPPGSSVLQSGSRYGHAQFDQQLHYQSWIWDGARQIFVVARRPATGRPDWILVQYSPLPSETQAIVTQFLTEDYVLVHQFEALSLDVDRVYDRQDAFFVPFAGFTAVERPGPNFSLFKRVSAPIL